MVLKFSSLLVIPIICRWLWELQLGSLGCASSRKKPAQILTVAIWLDCKSISFHESFEENYDSWRTLNAREVWNCSYLSNLTSLEKNCSKNQQQIRSLHLLSTTERYVAKGASLSCGFKFLRNCSYHPTAHNLQFSTLTPLSSVIEFLVKCKDWDPTGLIDSDFWSDPTAACRALFWKQNLSFVWFQHYTLTLTALFWHLFFQMHSKTLEQNYTHQIPF
jgi:hypothetical protein